MKRVLITGGTGFFGKSILDYYSRHSCEYEFKILSRHDGDIIGDVATFTFPKEHFDAILHLASPLLGGMSDGEAFSSIMAGTKHIAEFAKVNNATLLFASSGAVYGRLSETVSEDHPCDPVSGYGKAKLASECYFIEKNVDVKIARCFAFVGKYLPRNGGFAIGNFIRDAQAGNDIAINGDGTPMRSYMYADDLVEWLFAILERGTSGRPYNVGSPHAISIRDLAILVRDTLGSKSEVKVLGKPVPGAANYYVPNVDRVVSELNVCEKVGVREALLRSTDR